MPARHFVAVALLVAGCAAPVSTQERPVASASGARLVRTDLFASQDDRPIADLTAAEVQILEDGSPQTVESFTLQQPRSAADGLSLVVFVDTHHTILTGSSPARLALARAIETSMAGRGRVALTSPERLASELAFASPAEAVSSLAQPDWAWVRRDGAVATDPKENLYDSCFSNRKGGTEIVGRNEGAAPGTGHARRARRARGPPRSHRWSAHGRARRERGLAPVRREESLIESRTSRAAAPRRLAASVAANGRPRP